MRHLVVCLVVLGLSSTAVASKPNRASAKRTTHSALVNPFTKANDRTQPAGNVVDPWDTRNRSPTAERKNAKRAPDLMDPFAKSKPTAQRSGQAKDPWRGKARRRTKRDTASSGEVLDPWSTRPATSAKPKKRTLRSTRRTSVIDPWTRGPTAASKRATPSKTKPKASRSEKRRATGVIDPWQK